MDGRDLEVWLKAGDWDIDLRIYYKIMETQEEADAHEHREAVALEEARDRAIEDIKRIASKYELSIMIGNSHRRGGVDGEEGREESKEER